jgi:hypothetical protein
MFLTKIMFLFFNYLNFINSEPNKESNENIFISKEINDEINNFNQQVEIMNFAFSQVSPELKNAIFLSKIREIYDLLPRCIQYQLTIRFISDDDIYHLFPVSIQEEIKLLSTRFILTEMLKIVNLLNSITHINLEIMLDSLLPVMERQFIWDSNNIFIFINNLRNFLLNEEKNDNYMIIPEWLFN